MSLGVKQLIKIYIKQAAFNRLYIELKIIFASGPFFVIESKIIIYNNGIPCLYFYLVTVVFFLRDNEM